MLEKDIENVFNEENERDYVIKVFNSLISRKRESIVFSKGYPAFEEMYKLFSKDFELRRENKGDLVVITYVR